MIKVLIIDDEPKARVVLKTLLEDYKKDIKIVGEAASARTGKKMIEEFEPDLIFLDVEMPRVDGFKLLQMFDMISFDVIFTTAYSKYAINAIKFSAFDYLLKPIDIEELDNAILRFKQKMLEEKNKSEGIYFLPDNFTDLQQQHSKIALPTPKGFKVVRISDILYCEASRNYTIFYLSDNKKIIVGRNLKYFEQKLSSFSFIRIHESFMINLIHMDQYIKGRGGKVLLTNGAQLDVARSRKDDIMRFLK